MKLYCEGSSEGYNLWPYNVPYMSSRVVLCIFFWNMSSVSSWFCQSLKLTQGLAIKEAPLEGDLTQALKLKGTAIIVQSYQYCIQCRINHTQHLQFDFGVVLNRVSCSFSNFNLECCQYLIWYCCRHWIVFKHWFVGALVQSTIMILHFPFLSSVSIKPSAISVSVSVFL